MGKAYKNGKRACDGCHKSPRELGMRRFGSIKYKGKNFYVCPKCRKVIKGYMQAGD